LVPSICGGIELGRRNLPAVIRAAYPASITMPSITSLPGEQPVVLLLTLLSDRVEKADSDLDGDGPSTASDDGVVAAAQLDISSRFLSAPAVPDDIAELVAFALAFCFGRCSTVEDAVDVSLSMSGRVLPAAAAPERKSVLSFSPFTDP
jgi:hypothetical protein